jgi:hypothetical protein
MQVPILISAVDLWVVVGSVAGVVAAAAAVISVWHQLRSSKAKRDEQGPRAGTTKSPTAPAKPDFELKLSWMWPTYDNGTIGPDSIGLTLVNNLDHPIRWASASIDLQDGSGRHLALIDCAPPGMGVPQRIDAHDSSFTLVAAQQLRDQGMDLSRPIVGRANLATGETVISVPWTPGD